MSWIIYGYRLVASATAQHLNKKAGFTRNTAGTSAVISKASPTSWEAMLVRADLYVAATGFHEGARLPDAVADDVARLQTVAALSR